MKNVSIILPIVMKRKYFGFLFFWLAIFLGASFLTSMHPIKYDSNSIKFFYEKKLSKYQNPGRPRGFYYISAYDKIFSSTAIIGGLIILGIGFMDNKK